MTTTITPNLWFDTEAEEAANHYVSIFGGSSRVVRVTHCTAAAPGKEGTVLTVEFELDGQRFVAINGGPEFTFNEAISLQIEAADQDELDRYWAALTDGGEEGPCGWAKDRYGVSWQVVPESVGDLFADDDPERAERVMRVMFGMRKLDIAELRRAAAGEPVAAA